MKALIIGGGIAGPVSAMALMKAGIECTVFEAYGNSSGMAAGAYLTIAVNGVNALRAIDAENLVLDIGVSTRSIEFISDLGEVLGEVPIGPNLEDGTITQTMKRSDLYRAVHIEAQQRGVHIEYGRRLVSAETRSDAKVIAYFEDGRELGDMLIGADGVHSRVRLLLDPTAPEPRYTGFGNIGGFASYRVADDFPGKCRMHYCRSCFFGYTIPTADEVWWFANPPREQKLAASELRSMTTQEWQSRLVDDLKLDRSPVREIILATKGSLVASNQFDLPHVRVWHDGPMIIIGDAAHAPSPSSGQGASLAIEDAIVLAKCLRDLPTIPEAFSWYEKIRRPRVERVVGRGERANATKPRGNTLSRASDSLLKDVIERSSRREYWDRQAWLFDYRMDWDSRITSSAP